MADKFSETHPRFRLYLVMGILYWAVLLQRFIVDRDIHSGNGLSETIYIAFLIVFVTIYAFTWICDSMQKGHDLLYSIALFPLRMTLIALVISLSSLLFK